MIATKEQEREALKKIKEIVAGLGENSYVGTAFDGAFELAEDNIENDSAFSAWDWKKSRDEVEEKNKELRCELDRLKENLNREQSSFENMYKCCKEQEARAVKAEEKIDELEEEAKEQAEEIIRLKAKLYDMITRG